ncbi:terminase small subuniT [Caudoviricetes sp.]|nr:terminase small subuniT [Caudoviricetes sp.]UOF81023.1 terminase small subuniT [Caudoviricetes sp.]UOF81419.1 terminase small subuniT [Caudoviricetes sp.]
MKSTPLIDGLTVKESRAVSSFVNGAPSKTAAVRFAGYSGVHESAVRVFNRPRVRNALAAALEAKRIDEEGLAKKAKQLLNAKRPLVGKGGVITMVDDNATQVRIWELVAKVNGYLQENNVQINLLGDDDKREILERALSNTDRYKQALSAVIDINPTNEIDTQSQIQPSPSGNAANSSNQSNAKPSKDSHYPKIDSINTTESLGGGGGG